MVNLIDILSWGTGAGAGAAATSTARHPMVVVNAVKILMVVEWIE